MTKVNKNTTKIAVIFLDPVIEILDMRLVEKAQHMFLELPAALAGDDLHQLDAFVHRLLHNAIEFLVNCAPFIVNVVKVELEFRHLSSG